MRARDGLMAALVAALAAAGLRLQLPCSRGQS